MAIESKYADHLHRIDRNTLENTRIINVENKRFE